METVNSYRKIFDQEVAPNKSKFDAMAASGNGRTYYSFQYIASGTLAMYEATGAIKYLEQVLAWGKSMVANAKITDSNGNKNWSGIWVSAYSKTPISYMLEELQGATELARVARIVLTSPALKSAYGAQAVAIYSFVRDQIVEKHLFKRAGGLATFQRWLSITASATNDKPMLLLSILVDQKLSRDALGGNDKNYSGVLDDFAKGLKDHNGKKPRFTKYQGGLIWDIGMGFEPPYTSVDTMHANRLPPAMISLYKAGIVFDKSYVQGLADLFTKVIWNKSLTNPMFTNFIDGQNITFRPGDQNRGAWGNGMIYSGWAQLAEYDDTTLGVVDAVLKAILAGRKNPSLSYNASIYGRICLAACLAKAAAARETEPPPPPPPPPPDPVLTYMLTIASSMDVPISVSLKDNNAEGDGITSFARTYNKNTTVTLTAPAVFGGNNFDHWQREGVVLVGLVGELNATVIVDAAMTLIAVYVEPDIPPDPPDEPPPPPPPPPPVTEPPNPPTLQFYVAYGKLILHWDAHGFVLQETNEIAESAIWTDYPEGAASPVSVAITSVGTRIFRLRWTGL